MGSDRNDDSSGKWRTNDARSRSQLLLVALVAGLCLGVVFSERLYIRFQDQDTSPRLGASSGSGAGGRRKLGQVITAPCARGRLLLAERPSFYARDETAGFPDATTALLPRYSGAAPHNPWQPLHHTQAEGPLHLGAFRRVATRSRRSTQSVTARNMVFCGT